MLALTCTHCLSSFSAGTTGTEPPDASPDGAAGSQPVTLVSGESTPRGIAVDATHLYWVDAEDSTGGPGSVRSMLKDGTGGALTVAGQQMAPLDVAVDDTRIYWSVGTSGAAPATMQCLAMSVAKSTPAPAPTCVASGAFTPSRLALDTAHVLLLVENTVGPFVGIAAKTGVGALMTVPAQGPAGALVASDTAVYVGNAHGPHVDTFTLPALAIGTNVCTSGCGTAAIVDMALDAALGHLLWVTSAGEVVMDTLPPPVAAGTPLGAITGTPQRMARDASHLYIASQPGTIWAVPVSGGGAPVALATGENEPFGIAVDATRVYWTCGDGTIRAVAVPAP